MRGIASFLVALVLAISPAPAGARPQQSTRLSGAVEDENRQPIPGVQVTLRSETRTEQLSTNELGKFRFEGVLPGAYRLDFNKAGFFRVSDYAVTVSALPSENIIVLNHEYEIRSTVDVVASSPEIDPQLTQHADQLVAEEIREDPVPSSHSLQNALPALPGVVQDNNGLIHLAGARVEDTLYVLDGFEMNNPASGLFDARLNVDSVRAVDISTSRYGAEFANAASGVLAVQTDTGDDHWRFATTNFLPSFDLQRGAHLGNWYPRWNFSGPVRKGRAWFSDGLSLQHSLSIVRELPPGADTSQQWSGDNLLRARFNLSATQDLQGNFLYNSSTSTRSGLGPFSPASTTFDEHSRRYFLSLKDQIIVGNDLLEFGFASDVDRLNRLPQGSAAYVLTPTGPTGNYFERLVQNSHRWQARTDLTLVSRHWHGIHDLQLGLYGDATALDQVAARQPVKLVESNSALVRQAVFMGKPDLSVSEVQAGLYAQDLWRLRPDLVLQPAIRIDRNDLTHKSAVQPRLVVNWIPRANVTKFSAGWGLYYQPIYLSMVSPAHDQQRLDFLGDSAASAPIESSFSIPKSILQPYFETASFEWQEKWNAQTTSSLYVLTRRQHNGLVYEDVYVDPLRQGLQLNNSRADRYRAVEISLRHSLGNGGEVMADYTFSRARSNKIFDYSLDDLLLTGQAAGPLSWDVPHRLISRGSRQTNVWGLLLSYFAEYHTGYPFSAVNAQYQLTGVANGFRYPSYFNVNIGAERRFSFYHYQWAVRLSAINVSGHRNYNSVINNVDAPNFLTFAGGQHRAFTARLRLVGKK